MFPAVLRVITDASRGVGHESVGTGHKTVSGRSAVTLYTHPYEYTSVLIMEFPRVFFFSYSCCSHLEHKAFVKRFI